MASSRVMFGVLAVAAGLAGCSGLPAPTPNSAAVGRPDPAFMPGGLLAGDSGISFGVGGKSKGDTGNDTGGALGVNAYLWRGTLDTLSFMPLVSADPFGGVIITDWYQPPATTGERFKATAYILGRQLRADGIRIAIFRQVLQSGQWTDAPVSAQTTGEIENKVLQRARELREQSASN